MKKLISTLCLVGVSLGSWGVARAFWSYYPYSDHQDITKLALSAPNTFTFGGNQYSFSATAIDQINSWHTVLDWPPNYFKLLHFDSDSLSTSLSQMALNRRQLNSLLGNYVPNPAIDSPAMQAHAWQLLAYILHPVEDFYAHSTWVDGAETKLGNGNAILNFGALTQNTQSPTIPSYFIPETGTLCPAAGYPLLATPVSQLFTGFYPPAITPTGGCIHGELALIASSCLATVAPYTDANPVPGISHDIPCAAQYSAASVLHNVAEVLAEQEVVSLMQAIIADLDNVNNAAGFCALLGLPATTPICHPYYSVSVTVSGLAPGTNVVLEDDLDDRLTVPAPQTTGTFKTVEPNGSTYTVSIVTQPAGATCKLAANASGTIAGANVNVAVTCTANTAPAASAMVSAGEFNTCALSTSGIVYCWGYNNDGEIGNGTHGSTLVTTPVQVTGLSGVVGISVGWLHTCAVDGSGAAWCWGQNSLGAGNFVATPWVPQQVQNQSSNSPLSGVTAVSSGGAFSCALVGGGEVMCWGSNAQGQLGDNFKEASATAAVPVSNLSGVTAIAAGDTHVCALTQGGAVWCWGDDTFGEIGNGTYNTVSGLPSAVTGIPADIIGITAGFHSTCVLSASSGIWCWGYDLYGELGVGPPDVKYLTPMPVLSLASGATAVSTFGYATCAQIGGEMQCWGNGGLGLGGTVVDNSIKPGFVLNPMGTGPLTGVSQMSAGDGYACAVLSSGGVDCWGANNVGQLGNGTVAAGAPTYSTLPAPVLGVGGSGFLTLN